MQTGSIVQCVTDFADVKQHWNFPYPELNEQLVVSSVSPHPNDSVRRLGIVLLCFEEYPDTPGICDKTVEGKDNFVELLPPMEQPMHEVFQIEEEMTA